MKKVPGGGAAGRRLHSISPGSGGRRRFKRGLWAGGGGALREGRGSIRERAETKTCPPPSPGHCCRQQTGGAISRTRGPLDCPDPAPRLHRSAPRPAQRPEWLLSPARPPPAPTILLSRAVAMTTAELRPGNRCVCACRKRIIGVSGPLRAYLSPPLSLYLSLSLFFSLPASLARSLSLTRTAQCRGFLTTHDYAG